MALKWSKLAYAAEQVARRFVAMASLIPEVQLILLEEESTGGRCILTVIDAPPFDSGCRSAVFAAERAAMPSTQEPPVAFRLANVREFKDRTVDYYVGPNDQILFRRGAHA